MLDMTQGDSMNQLIQYTLPLILGNLFQLTYNLVDTLVVGQFSGKNSLAAVGTCDPVMNLLILGVSGICIGASVIMSRFFGSGQTEKLRKELETTLMMGFCFAAFILVSGMVLARPILRLLKVPEKIMPESITYLRVIFVGLPFTCLYNIYAAALRSIGNTREPTRYLVLASLLNMGMDVVFVAVFHWGVFGAGLATILAQAFSAVLCIRHVQKNVPLLHCQLRLAKPDPSLVRETIRLGGLTALQQCSQPIGKLFIQGTVNSMQSVAAIAAFNAVGKVEDIGLVPGRSIADAIMTFTAQNMGARQPERAEKGFRQGILLEILCGVAVSLFIWFMRGPLMHIFTTDEEIISQGMLYFTLIGFCYWVPGLTNGHQGYYRGVGAMKVVLCGTLTQISVRTISSMVLVPRFGIEGVAWGCLLGWSMMLAWEIPYRIYLSRKLRKESRASRS